MLINLILLLVGFAVLSWAADRLVTGASAIARNMGIAPLIIGLTVIALGTSAPEIFVAVNASLNGNSQLAIGNAIGSNIANIGLVLGVTALIQPLTVQSKVLRREYPILFLIMLIALYLLGDGVLGVVDGVILLIGLLILTITLIVLGRPKKNHEPLSAEFADEIPCDMPNKIAVMWLLIGLVLLPLASKLIVHSSVLIAKHFGLSDLVIGLTIVAIGTSLPEVAASIAGALKGEHDIAIGNILGSNMFNLLAVLPFPGLLAPGKIEPQLLTRDIPVMYAITLLLFLTAYGFRTQQGRINRWEGGLLLGSYIGYLVYVTV